MTEIKDVLGSWGFKEDKNLEKETRMNDRLLYVAINLVGQYVEVQVIDGTWYEGIFHTSTAAEDGGFGVVLKMVKNKDNVLSESKGRVKPIPTMVIKPNDFVQLRAIDVSFDDKVHAISSGAFLTDTEISSAAGGELGERKLVPWMPSENDPELPALGNGEVQGWDQFKANKKLFKVETSYKDDLSQYSVPIPENSALAASAAKLAREFVQTPSSNPHVREERGEIDDSLDEEDRYGAVLRRDKLYNGKNFNDRGKRGSGTKNNGKGNRRNKDKWSKASSGNNEKWRKQTTSTGKDVSKSRNTTTQNNNNSWKRGSSKSKEKKSPKSYPSSGTSHVSKDKSLVKVKLDDTDPSSEKSPSISSLPKEPFSSKMNANAKTFTPGVSFPKPPPAHTPAVEIPNNYGVPTAYGIPPAYPMPVYPNPTVTYGVRPGMIAMGPYGHAMMPPQYIIGSPPGSPSFAPMTPFVVGSPPTIFPSPGNVPSPQFVPTYYSPPPNDGSSQ